jgi:pSer/pThr/pTyr-binding forkhead associated (FHA) protein
MRMASDSNSPALRTDLAAPAYKVVLPQSVRLVVVVGPDQGRIITLAQGPNVVGKAEGCALVLTDPAVSRQHLEFEVTGDGVVVRDLGSTNGSFFAGTRFREVTVGIGANLTIGSTSLRLIGPNDVEPPRLSSSAEHFGRLVGSSSRW